MLLTELYWNFTARQFDPSFISTQALLEPGLYYGGDLTSFMF